MGAAAERGREPRPEQAPLGHDHVQEGVEAVVEEDLGVVDHDQVDPDEHLEHALGEVEVHRAERLRVGARPVEEGVVALPPDRQLHLERAVAEAVVVDVVLEGLRLLGDRDLDQEPHRLVRAVEERLERRQVDVLAEAVAELDDALLAGPAARDDREEVGPVHLGQPHVVEDQLEDGLLGLAPLEDLDRRNDEALLEDRPRARRAATPGSGPPQSIWWPNWDDQPTSSSS